MRNSLLLLDNFFCFTPPSVARSYLFIFFFLFGFLGSSSLVPAPSPLLHLLLLCWFMSHSVTFNLFNKIRCNSVAYYSCCCFVLRKQLLFSSWLSLWVCGCVNAWMFHPAPDPTVFLFDRSLRWNWIISWNQYAKMLEAAGNISSDPHAIHH